MRARPFLYHLTDWKNLGHIRETRRLFSATTLLERSGRADLIRARRSRHEPVKVEGAVIMIRDQAPLHRGNLELPSGYTFEDFVELRIPDDADQRSGLMPIT